MTLSEFSSKNHQIIDSSMALGYNYSIQSGSATANFHQWYSDKFEFANSLMHKHFPTQAR